MYHLNRNIGHDKIQDNPIPLFQMGFSIIIFKHFSRSSFVNLASFQVILSEAFHFAITRVFSGVLKVFFFLNLPSDNEPGSESVTTCISLVLIVGNILLLT